MKRIFTFLIASGFFLSASAQVVYQENFNTNDGGWTATGSWAHGTPSSAVIVDQGPCGAGAWVTNLAGDYGNNANDILTSPIMDCSFLATDAVIYFDLAYETESCCDEAWIEYKIDTGATWTKLLDAGSAIGWYNDAGNQWWDGGTGAWNLVGNTIPGSAYSSNVQVRIILSTDGSVTRDGFGIDNVIVAESYTDLNLIGISNVASGIPYSSSESLSVDLVNNGTFAETGFSVCYILNGGTAVCETVTASVAPGPFTYTFTATEDLSVDGTYSFVTYLSGLTLDAAVCNDTATNVIQLTSPVSSFPYIETFEGPNDWILENSWEIGMPIVGNEFENMLACSSDTLVCGTVINGNYYNSSTDYVYSPNFDFSAMTLEPSVKFDFFYETESCCDEGWLELSIDGGATWAKVMASSDANNWYNDASNNWWDGDLAWTYAATQLTGAAGVSVAQFRFVFSSDGSVIRPGFAFDNFTVVEGSVTTEDAITQTVGLNAGLCAYGMETVTADFVNIGGDSIIGFIVCYDLGTGPVCETLLDTILPGATFTHNFAVQVDLTGLTSASITASIDAADGRPCNDDIQLSFLNPATPIVANLGIFSSITCNGDADGSVLAAPTGGDGSYSYVWSNGDVTALSDSITATNQIVTITDGNGCTVVDSIVGYEPPAVAVSISIISAISCNGDANGEITANATGGNFQFTYAWSTGTANNFVDSLVAGNYVVTVVDSVGCSAVDSISLTEPTALIASSNVDSDVSCNGLADGSATASATGSSAPYTYLWNNSATTEVVTGLVAGTYNVIVTDATGCVDSIETTIVEPNAIVTTITTTGIDITADELGASYQWLDCDDLLSSIAGETNQTLTASANGNYAVEITVGACVDTSTCENISSVNIEPLLFGANIQLYPNPTQGDISIDFGSENTTGQLRLLSVDGKLISVQNILEVSKMNFTIEGAPGIYFIELVSGNESVTYRLIKN